MIDTAAIDAMLSAGATPDQIATAVQARSAVMIAAAASKSALPANAIPALSASDFSALGAWLIDGVGWNDFDIPARAMVAAIRANNQPEAWKQALIFVKNVLYCRKDLLS